MHLHKSFIISCYSPTFADVLNLSCRASQVLSGWMFWLGLGFWLQSRTSTESSLRLSGAVLGECSKMSGVSHHQGLSHVSDQDLLPEWLDSLIITLRRKVCCSLAGGMKAWTPEQIQDLLLESKVRWMRFMISVLKPSLSFAALPNTENGVSCPGFMIVTASKAYWASKNALKVIKLSSRAGRAGYPFIPK